MGYFLFSYAFGTQRKQVLGDQSAKFCSENVISSF